MNFLYRLIFAWMILSPSAAFLVSGQDGIKYGLGWIRMYLPAGRATDQDVEARQALLEHIDKNQEEEFRSNFTVDVPERATGLPRDYDILIYGQHATKWVRRLEVQVRGDHATGQLATPRTEFRRGEFRRGELPAEAIDSLTRQLIYSAMATEREKTVHEHDLENNLRSKHYANHTMDERIEVISRDTDHPFHLKTDARQPLARKIGLTDSGVTDYAHARFWRDLITMAVRLPEEQLGPELGQELARRLRDLKLPSTSELSKDRVQGGEIRLDQTNQYVNEAEDNRVNLSEIECLVYGQLVVDCRAKEALPELVRIGMHKEFAMLRLATADDSSQLLKNALEGEDFEIYSFALRFATTPLTPKNIDVMLDSLPQLKAEFRFAAVLKALDMANVSTAQIQRVRDFHKTVNGLRSRVATARFLLWTADDPTAFEELMPLATVPLKDDSSGVYLAEKDALDALLAYSTKTGKRRTDAVKIIRTLLDQIPATAHSTYSRKDYLIQYLGRLGDTTDIPRLKLHIRDDAYLSSMAINSVAMLDAAEGIQLAHQQIERFIGDTSRSVNFGWCVIPYLDLIVQQQDRRSAELIEAALSKYRRRAPELAADETSVALVLNYLRAENAEARAKHAVKYFRGRGGNWIAELGKRLIAEGADPKTCQPLLP